MYTWAIVMYHGTSLTPSCCYYTQQATAFKLAKEITLDEDLRGVAVRNLLTGEEIHMAGEEPAHLW